MKIVQFFFFFLNAHPAALLELAEYLGLLSNTLAEVAQGQLVPSLLLSGTRR